MRSLPLGSVNLLYQIQTLPDAELLPMTFDGGGEGPPGRRSERDRFFHGLVTLRHNKSMRTTLLGGHAGILLSVGTLLWACGSSTVVGGGVGDEQAQVGLGADAHPETSADSAATEDALGSQVDVVQQEPDNPESASHMPSEAGQDGAVEQSEPVRTCSELQFRKDSERATGVEACVDGNGLRDFRVTQLHDSCDGAGVGAQVDGGFSAPQPPPCQSDAECEAEGATCFEGMCHLPPVCEQRPQCGEGETCLCALWEPTPDVGGGAAYHSSNRCVPEQCESADDCGDRECAVTQDQCGQLSGVYCRTDQDECKSTADCGANQRCSYVTQQARWQCVEAADCD